RPTRPTRLTRPTRPTRPNGAFYVLDVKEQQSIRVLPDRADRIAAALLIMGDIELELDISRVGRLEDLIDLPGAFANRIHVVVVAERDAQVCAAFADFSEQASQPL